MLKDLPLGQVQEQELEAQIDGAASRMMNKLLFGLRDEISENAFRECVQGMEKVYGMAGGES